MNDSPNERWPIVPEIATRHISAPIWLVTLIGSSILAVVGWSLLGIASDARLGHDLAVQIERDQRIFSSTLANIRNDLQLERQARHTLREQVLLLDYQSKAITDISSRQNKVLETLGDFTHRIKALENIKHPDPWVVEQLRNHGQRIDDLRQQLGQIRRHREGAMVPEP